MTLKPPERESPRQTCAMAPNTLLLIASRRALFHSNRFAAFACGSFLALAIYSEREFDGALFTLSVGTSLSALAFMATGRLRFSVLFGMCLLSLSAIASLGKFAFLAFNVHVLDIWLYFVQGAADGAALGFLVDQFTGLVLVAVVVIVLATLLLVTAYRLDSPQRAMGRAALVALVAAAMLPATLPAESRSVDYHMRKSHFMSSFFASLFDLKRLAAPSPLAQRLGTSGEVAPFDHAPACQPGSAPDIVLVLSESAVPPAQAPGWRYDPSLMARFASQDGVVRAAGVETHGGGTWISEASVMSGLSMASFGWMRPYATVLLRDRIHNGLPAALAACGYATAFIMVNSYGFLGNGPMMTSLGFKDYLDRGRMQTKSQHEPDAFYYRHALDYLARHRRADGRPLFLFIETATAHSPYDSRFEPQRVARGEPFGNDAQTDEYLRRLTFAQEDYAAFGQRLAAMGERPVLLAQFGDHHPIVTRQLFDEPKARNAPEDFTSAMYQTFYAVTPIGFEPRSQLPSAPVLDLAFLGVTLMEAAGLPLPPSMIEQRALRDLCNGRFHTCERRDAVDSYLRRLIASNMLDRF